MRETSSGGAGVVPALGLRLGGPGVDDGQGARGVEVVGERRADLARARRPAGPSGRETAARQRASRCCGPQQVGAGPLPVGAVVVREQRQPDRHRVDARRARSLETKTRLPLRLGHLLAVQRDHAGVHVGLGERALAGEHLGVRGAHLVVREDQVGAAALDVERHARGAPARWRRTRCASRGGPRPSAVVPGRARPGRAASHSRQSSGCFLPGAVGVAAALGEERAASARGVEAGDRAEVRVGVHREVDVVVDS